MSNILINKSKKELVDIIIRKDDVHKRLKKNNEDLRSEIKALDHINKDYYDKIKDLVEVLKDKDINIANLNKQVNEFTDSCDEYASKCQELINKRNKFKNLAVFSNCISIVILILMLISLWMI